jgi:hypothetical protein
MLAPHTDRWLQIIDRVIFQEGWDKDAVVATKIGEHSFAVRVRESDLGFVIVQPAGISDRFAISYTSCPPAHASNITTGFESALYRPAAHVDAELEKWLRHSVSRCLSEQRFSQ